MDSETRLKVLERLVQSDTPKSGVAIGRACEQAYTVLKESSDYDSLEFNIEVLFVAGFRHAAETVASMDQFIGSVEGRKLTYSNEHAVLFPNLIRYRNGISLVVKCIKVLLKLRYLETSAVVGILLRTSMHQDQEVRTESTNALKALACFNLFVYYGNEADGHRGIGAIPQLAVIKTLEKTRVEDLLEQLPGVLSLLEGLLSPVMESTNWSSGEVTFMRGVTPAEPNVLKVRSSSIDLLKKLYRHCSSKSQKLAIIAALNTATRFERQGGNDHAYNAMISTNARDVLTFFEEVVNNEDLQIVQKIEHDSYWIQFNSPDKDVKVIALRVKAAIDANSEYEIYRTLIGFEGIFGDWSASTRDESFEIRKQDARKNEARALVARIPDEGFDRWHERILTFAKTESNDLATFPVFYEFLADVAQAYPTFALRLLTNDSRALSTFLIPLLRGLWESEQRDELVNLIGDWIRSAQLGEMDCLFSCAKVFLSTTSIDVALFRQLLEKAVELADIRVLRQVAAVSAARYDLKQIQVELKVLFLKALSNLTALGDAYWIGTVWFLPEAKNMLSKLSVAERSEVLNNLILLPRIDYQAEDVLAVIAESDVDQVIDFLCARLYAPTELAMGLSKKDFGSYVELPYQLSTLQEPLSKVPRTVLQKVFECYRKDPVLFEFKGAKLLQIIFPQFSESFEKALLQLMHEGGDVVLEFTAGVLRAYSGEAFLYKVAKELVKRLPPGSSLLSVVSIALQSTGVVSGEYGFVDAYERKRHEVLDWLQDPDERVRAFAEGYIAELVQMRDREKERADEKIVLRKFSFGDE